MQAYKNDTVYFIPDDSAFDTIETTKKYLSLLIKQKGYNYYPVIIGNFRIDVKTNAEWSNPPNIEYRSLTQYKTVSVEVWEGPSPWMHVHCNRDYRFKKFYENVIKKTEDDWTFGTCYGVDIQTLCELVMYVYKIYKLSVFY